MKKRQQHKLSKLDLLQHARDGALTTRGVSYEMLDDEELELLEKDIREIERRIKPVAIAAEKAAS